jgi:hypothetical protein
MTGTMTVAKILDTETAVRSSAGADSPVVKVVPSGVFVLLGPAEGIDGTEWVQARLFDPPITGYVVGSTRVKRLRGARTQVEGAELLSGASSEVRPQRLIAGTHVWIGSTINVGDGTSVEAVLDDGTQGFLGAQTPVVFDPVAPIFVNSVKPKEKHLGIFAIGLIWVGLIAGLVSLFAHANTPTGRTLLALLTFGIATYGAKIGNKKR